MRIAGYKKFLLKKRPLPIFGGRIAAENRECSFPFYDQ
jgi:hypothetical protein